MYHRIIDDTFDPYSTIVNINKFEGQVKYLKRNYNVIPFEEIGTYKSNGLPYVVITFDDGYVDNYRYAAPILEKYQMPAIFFVTTEKIGGNSELWDNDFIRILLYKTTNEKTLRIDSKKIFKITESDLNESIYDIHDYLIKLDNKTRGEIIKNMEAVFKPSIDVRENYRIMNEHELREIDASNYLTIGNHGYSHSRMTSETNEGQKEELIESTNRLTQILGRQIDMYSFPFGGQKDCSEYALNLLKELNYKCVARTDRGQINKKTNKFNIPRWNVGNWDEDEFANRINSFFLG